MDEPLVISWSEIDAWRQCPYKWLLAYHERWTGPTTSLPLRRGTLWHKVLEIHYTHHDSLDEAVEQVGRYLQVVDETEDVVQTILWMYQGYVQAHFEIDRGWTIRMIEGRLELPLMAGIRIKCRLDLVVADEHGRTWLIDHKSGRYLPSGREIDLDDQFALYQWLLRQSGRPVFGIIHNAARTQQNQTPLLLEDRFKRYKMLRIDSELDTMIDEIRSTALDIRMAHLGIQAAQPITAVAPRHPDSERCRWRCGFTDPCLLGRKTGHHRTQEMLADMGFVQDFTRH